MIGFIVLNLFYLGLHLPSCNTLLLGAAVGALNAGIIITRNKPSCSVMRTSLENLGTLWVFWVLCSYILADGNISVCDVLVCAVGMVFVGVCCGLSFMAGESIGRKACGCG